MRNMGGFDRIFRVIIAAVMVALYWQGMVSGFAGIIMLMGAFIFLFTSVIGSCPMYFPFGITTEKRKKKI